MSSDLTVACVHVRPKYSPDYVDLLQDAVARHLPQPYRFVCITDQPRTVMGRHNHRVGGKLWPGWWSKMHLFDPEILRGRVIYLDLDTLVLDSLIPLVALPPGFYMLRDFLVPERYGSGVMVIDGGSSECKSLYNYWKSNPRAHISQHLVHGDQEFIARHYPGEIRRLQEYVSGIVSVRVDCSRGESGPPARSRLVCFHGQQKPHLLPVQAHLRALWLGETR